MAHGGHARPPRRAAERRLRSRGPAICKNNKKLRNNKQKKQQVHKPVSLKNQIRSAERLLRKKNLPPEIRESQQKKLEELTNQQELQNRLAVERKISLRYRKIKFFERRKIERRIRRLEKQLRVSVDLDSQSMVSELLAQLKEDLQYVRFFPKTEKYVALFVGGDNPDVIEKREKLRKQIKENIAAAVASGKDLEETASDDDELLDLSEDDFFVSGSSNDEGDADDEWTDRSAREPASSASGKVASGMSSDEKNQRHMADRARMPPPRPIRNSFRADRDPARLSHRGQNTRRKPAYSTSSQTSYGRSDPSSRNLVTSSARADHSSNLSSNSDARKPRRKRRPKKKKQAQD